MTFHVVMMRLTGADDAFLAHASHYAERVRRKLPHVRDYQFGRHVAARAKGFTWTVTGTFDSSTDHGLYQVSALHQEMKAFMSPHIADIVACDDGTAGGK